MKIPSGHILFLAFCIVSGNGIFGQSGYSMPPHFVSHSQKGTITLLATGFGNKKDATANALESAFDALLFHGIAGAPKPVLRDPFLNDESSAWENHPDFLRHFFSNKGYMDYLLFIGKPEKIKIKGLGEKKACQVKMTINYKALLRDLRKEGLIPRPGF